MYIGVDIGRPRITTCTVHGLCNRRLSVTLAYGFSIKDGLAIIPELGSPHNRYWYLTTEAPLPEDLNCMALVNSTFYFAECIPCIAEVQESLFEMSVR